MFAEMLSLPNDGRYPALIMDLQQRRQKTLEALTGRGADRLVAPALQELRRGVNDAVRLPSAGGISGLSTQSWLLILGGPISSHVLCTPAARKKFW